jgi:hypothetical protein
MRILISALALLVALSACVETAAPPPVAPKAPPDQSNATPDAATPIDVDGEVVHLRERNY